MTVQTLPPPPPSPTRATTTTTTTTKTPTTTTLNKRFPPLADRSSLPHRLTGLSRQKLAREATAPDPDVRRCLAHFRLHVASMEWTSKDVRSQISSVELEEEEEDDEDEDANQKARELEERLSRQSGAEVKKEEKSDSPPQQSSPAPDVVRVSFHVQPRPVSNDEESVQQEQPQQEQQEQQQQPPSPPRKDDGILERSRSCLGKTGQKKHFWLSSGQCVPVRIAS